MLRLRLFLVTAILLMFPILTVANQLVFLPGVNKTDTSLYQAATIYHFTPTGVIAETTPAQLHHLESTTRDWQVIDTNPWSQPYYLISSPKGEPMRVPPDWGRVIHEETSQVIVKTDRLPFSEVVNRDYNFVELRKIARRPPAKIQSPALARSRALDDLEDIITAINADSIAYIIQSLQDFGTRFCLVDNHPQVVDWIVNRFEQIGFTDVERDSFWLEWNGYEANQMNVVATLPGTIYPDEKIILGGHFDSIVHFGPNPDPWAAAPGADDNASGTAAALEIARVLKALNYEPKVTLQFVAFAAEEVGLEGSFHHAQTQAYQQENIRVMINNDMIANNSASPDNWTGRLYYYTGYEYLLDLSLQLATAYTAIMPLVGGENSSGSDSFAYWNYGFPAFYFFETEFSPYYHSIYDIIDNCDLEYCAEMVRLNSALMIYLAEMPGVVRELELLDMGNGSDLYVHWNYPGLPNLTHFNIGIGTQPGVYDAVYTSETPEYTLTGLTEGQYYYIGVSAVTDDNMESFILEVEGSPQNLPRVPAEFAATPQFGSIRLTWRPNPETDLDSYELYRSETADAVGEVLSTTPILIPEYTDLTAQNGVYYYYSVRAKDHQGNYSEFSESLRSRVVSLDQGVLLVDATPNGNGGFLRPTDDDCDNYYHTLLGAYDPAMYDLNEEGRIDLADLGAYSTVVWFKDSMTGNSFDRQMQLEIEKYLDFGGKMLVCGIYPTDHFSQMSNRPGNFLAYELMATHFKVAGRNYVDTARFFNAVPAVPDFDPLVVDTTKTVSGLDFHLIRIESLTPTNQGTVLYTYASQYPNNDPYGVMNGEPVGIGYFGADYQTVFLTFPLFYMNMDDAQNLIDQVVHDLFLEPNHLEGEVVHNRPTMLYQNYPNPFNPATVIRFQLSVTGPIELSIYNISGQLVQELESGSRLPGTHEIVWDGTNDAGLPVGSGIYFYRLTTGDGYDETRSMLLLK